MVSSGMIRRVALVRTDVSEEPSASFIRVTRIGELGTTIAATSNRRTLRRVSSQVCVGFRIQESIAVSAPEFSFSQSIFFQLSLLCIMFPEKSCDRATVPRILRRVVYQR
jgi:hypothetical protein